MHFAVKSRICISSTLRLTHACLSHKQRNILYAHTLSSTNQFSRLSCCSLPEPDVKYTHPTAQRHRPIPSAQYRDTSFKTAAASASLAQPPFSCLLFIITTFIKYIHIPSTLTQLPFPCHHHCVTTRGRMASRASPRWPSSQTAWSDPPRPSSASRASAARAHCT